MNAFASWDELDRFWGEQMKAMYQGEAIGRFNAELKVIGDACAATDEGSKLPVAYIGDFQSKDMDSGKALLQAIKYIINDLRFPNTKTQAGTVATTPKDKLILILNKDVEPNLDVYTKSL